MSPVLVIAVVAAIIVAMTLGYKLVTQLANTRAQLLREERQRQDAAAKAQAGDPVLNTLGDVFDPIHLFH